MIMNISLFASLRPPNGASGDVTPSLARELRDRLGSDPCTSYLKKTRGEPNHSSDRYNFALNLKKEKSNNMCEDCQIRSYGK